MSARAQWRSTRAVSDPIVLDAPLYGPAAGLQHAASLAPDGDGWFAVWSDDREWNQQPSRTNFSEWIFGAHVDAQGVISPPASIHLAGDTYGYLEQPAIAPIDGGFVLAYAGGINGDQLIVQMLDAAGSPSALPLAIATSTATFGIDGVHAFDVGGGHVVIAWDERFGGNEYRLNFHTVDASGTIVGAFAIRGGDDVPIACSASGCTVLTDDGDGPLAIDIALDGTPGAMLRVSDSGSPQAVARASSTTFAFYTGARGALFMKRIANGQVLDEQPISVFALTMGAVRAVSRASDVVVATTSNTEDAMLIARYTDDLLAYQLSSVPSTYPLKIDAVAWNAGATRALISGTHGRDEIEATRFDEGTAPLDWPLFAVSQSANRQSAPSIAFGGGIYLLAWEDMRSSPPAIMAQRIDSDGATLGSAFAIAETTEGARPRIGYDGTQFWIAWSHTAELARDLSGTFDVFARRVGVDGALLDAAPIAIAAGRDKEVDARVVCAGSTCFIVWSDFEQQRGQMRRTLSDGTVLDPAGLPICNSCEHANVGTDGARLIAVWEGSNAGPLSMRRFALDGTPLGAALLVNADDSFASNDDIVLAGATSTTAVALRWDGSSGPHTVLLDATGSALTVRRTCDRCSRLGDTTGVIVFDGRDFITAAAGSVEIEYPLQRTFVGRVSTSAESLDALPVALMNAELAAYAVSAASDGRGHTLVIRSAHQEDPATQIERLEALLLTNPRVMPPLEMDGGVQVDSSVDAGDAASIDANDANDANDAAIDAGVDAGATSSADAGSTIDAGIAAESDEGCSCDASTSGTRSRSGAASALLVVLLLFRRRAQRRLP